MGVRFRRAVRWDEIRPLLPFGLLGVVLGTTLLVNLPHRPLLAALGALVLFFGLRAVLDIHGESPISRLWAAPAGLIGGTVSALFGTGGPPYIIYLTHRIRDHAARRASFSALFLIEGSARLAVYVAFGLLWDAQVWWSLLAAVPLCLLGLYVGDHAHMPMSATQAHRLIGLLLLLSGVFLLIKAFLRD